MATTYWGSLPELHEVIALARSGRIRTNVERFRIDDAVEVYRRMAAGELNGRAVIVPE